MYQTIGLIGTLLFVIAYIPQVILLMRKRKTEGVSLHSWLLWSIATVLVLVHALSGTDRVYQLFSLANAFFILTITTLLFLYQRRLSTRSLAKSEPHAII